MHPLLTLATSRPQLLVDHAAAYAELASAELGWASARIKRQAVLAVAATLLLGLALVLAGVAGLLWASVPVASMPAPWALWALPLAPALLALVCTLISKSGEPAQAFEKLKLQARTDLALWREMSAP
jgi:hypothetical protein